MDHENLFLCYYPGNNLSLRKSSISLYMSEAPQLEHSFPEKGNLGDFTDLLHLYLFFKDSKCLKS